MAKKFITSLALQSLDSYKYNTLGNDKLAYSRETCFPVIPLIFNNVAENDEITVIVLKTESDVEGEREKIEKNQEKLEAELKVIAAEKSFKYQVRFIMRPYEDTRMAHMELYKKIIAIFEDNDIIFTDITYSTKTMPIILFAALRYAYALKKGVEIACISYGNLNFHETDPGQKANIYDVTSLFHIDSIVESVARMNVDNPQEVINVMLDLKSK